MKKKIRKLFELSIEKIFLLCGTITSITIVLIILFLFREGFGLFKNNSIDEDYAIVVNSQNPINSLTSRQIKNIFDTDIITWKDVGGRDENILVFRTSDFNDYLARDKSGNDMQYISSVVNDIVKKNSNIIAFIPKTLLPKTFEGKVIDIGKIQVKEVFIGTEWLPTSQPSPLFGLLPLILGTMWVSFGAILIALPFGLGVAIYIAEIAHDRTRKYIKPVIELLAGIPSVVFGFFGLVVIVPLIKETFNLPVGETAIAGSIILAIMSLPTIITIAEDSMRTVPRSVKEASLALGATHWQTIWKIVIPYSVSGILTAIVLGIGRAIGETMAVLMVTGNSAIIPTSFFEPVRTIPATIAAELGEAPKGGTHYEALFLLGCILFVITLTISVVAELVSSNKHKSPF